MQLCEWMYGDGEEGSWVVTAWVHMELARQPPGFVARLRYEAWAEQLGPMGQDSYGDPKRERSAPIVDRLEAMQPAVAGLVASGVDPLFELCRQQPSRLVALKTQAEELAAAYEQLLLSQAAGAANAKSSGPKRV